MVFFTCNHCGESVKKTSVAKHYQTKCRNIPIFISCMDCQKDFKLDEYVAHTSCITEAQKYSGKDYVPKPSYNAGLKKQQSWLEVVRSILDENDLTLSGEVRRVLQRLQSYDNVPRKKEKFLNFVSNSLRIKRNQAEPVWKVVEKALAKYNEIRFGPATKNGTNGEATNGQKDEATINDTSSTAEATEKKKDKSKKRKENLPTEISLVETESGEPTKESKKKKRALEANGSEPQLQNGSIANGDCSPKKKKKPSESQQDVDTTMDNTTAEIKSAEDPTKFNWLSVIFDVVEKNKEIPVEKLKKKVLKKYKKFHNVKEIEGNVNKVEKTFKKKLNGSGLLVVDNLVKAS